MSRTCFSQILVRFASSDWMLFHCSVRILLFGPISSAGINASNGGVYRLRFSAFPVLAATAYVNTTRMAATQRRYRKCPQMSRPHDQGEASLRIMKVRPPPRDADPHAGNHNSRRNRSSHQRSIR